MHINDDNNNNIHFVRKCISINTLIGSMLVSYSWDVLLLNYDNNNNNIHFVIGD